MGNEIITLANFTAFLVPEILKGVPVLPTSANAIRLGADPELPAQPGGGFEPIIEAVGTRSATGQVRKAQEPGTVKFSAFFCPSGVAGTEPAEAALLKALLGKETKVAAKVTYAPSFAKGSWTLWVMAENLVLFAAGLVMTNGKFSQKKGVAAALEFNGSFMRRGFAGESPLTADAAEDVTALIVADASHFAVGASIAVGDDTNDAAGYQITAINLTTNTLTIAPGLTAAALTGAAVTGWLPVPVIVGAPVEDVFGFSLAGTPLPWSSWEINVEEPAAFQTDEVPADPDAEDFPSGYVLKAGRAVTVKIEANLRTADAARFRADKADKALVFDLSRATIPAGERVKITLPTCKVDVPETSTGDASAKMTLNAVALSATGETEISIEYT